MIDNLTGPPIECQPKVSGQSKEVGLVMCYYSRYFVGSEFGIREISTFHMYSEIGVLVSI